MDLNKIIDIGLLLKEMKEILLNRDFHSLRYKELRNQLEISLLDLILEKDQEEDELNMMKDIKSILVKSHKESMKEPSLYEDFKKYLEMMMGFLQLLKISGGTDKKLLEKVDILVITYYSYLNNFGISGAENKEVDVIIRYIDLFLKLFNLKELDEKDINGEPQLQ